MTVPILLMKFSALNALTSNMSIKKEFTSKPRNDSTSSTFMSADGRMKNAGTPKLKAIALIIAGCAIFYALQNLTTTERTYKKYKWTQNPETGEWEWKLTEEETEKKPPSFWDWIPLIMILMVLMLFIYMAGGITQLFGVSMPKRRRRKRRK